MTVPLISIIVPVYNSEKALSRCINSILNQTFYDWELLLIDDGSTDQSGKICDQYAATDQRIKVFHKENGGVSSARNLGLDNVRGEWITFSDSDDEILNHTFALYNTIIKEHNDIDLICCGYRRCNKSGSFTNVSYVECLSADKEANLLMLEESGYWGFLWNKCFRASVAKKYRFDEIISWCEDHLYAYRCLLRCQCVYFSPDIVYKYYVNDMIFKGKGNGLSSCSLDYKMVINVANIERNLRYEFYKNNEKLKLIIEAGFILKVKEAIYYACINGHFVDAYKIYKKYYFGGRLQLFRYFMAPFYYYIKTIVKSSLKSTMF